MRELEVEITREQLAKGLMPSEWNEVDAYALEEALNFRVTEQGLEAITEEDGDYFTVDIDPTSLYREGIDDRSLYEASPLYLAYGISPQPPYPQVFAGSRHTLMATSSRLYLVAYDNSLTLVGDLGGGSYQWSFLDYGEVIFLVNDTGVYKFGWSDVSSSYIVSKRGMKIGACVGIQFQGRTILGNFGSNDVFAFSQLKPNSIWWSTVGGGELDTLFRHGTLDVDVLQGMEIGALDVEGVGYIMGLSAMHNGILVYGSEGVAFLTQIVEPVVTFGQRKLMSVGCLSSCSFDGTLQEQLFLDSKRRIWRVGADLKMQYLRYDNYTSLLSEPITVVYNALNKEYYISSQTGTLLVTDFGVTRLPYTITALLYRDGSTLIVR